MGQKKADSAIIRSLVDWLEALRVRLRVLIHIRRIEI